MMKKILSLFVVTAFSFVCLQAEVQPEKPQQVQSVGAEVACGHKKRDKNEGDNNIAKCKGCKGPKLDTEETTLDGCSNLAGCSKCKSRKAPKATDENTVAGCSKCKSRKAPKATDENTVAGCSKCKKNKKSVVVETTGALVCEDNDLSSLLACGKCRE